MSNKVIVNGVDVFEELEKKEKLLNQIKDIINRPIYKNYDYYIAIINKYFEIEKLIEELENE